MQNGLFFSASKGQLEGSVDRFIAPRLLSGWVRKSELTGNGNDIRLFVFSGDRIIAEGRPARARYDIVNDPDYLTEFSLYCSEDISYELIAFSLLKIEARDSDGMRGLLPIWDVVRGHAFDHLMQSSTPLGMAATSAVLRGLAQNPELPNEARQSILRVNDLHFAADITRLMYQFESLGKDCSLGSIQRSFGAEPLGLMRFTGISVEAVITALKDRFRGVGDPEFTKIETSDTGEYYSADTRYNMSSHTFIFAGDVEFNSFYKQYCKKLGFLVRNMLEKLEAGEKIFVIHAIPETISPRLLDDLFETIRSFGSSWLLYLEAATETSPPGTLVVRQDGLITGYVLQIQGELIAPVAEVRESWVKVLRLAAASVVQPET